MGVEAAAAAAATLARCSVMALGGMLLGSSSGMQGSLVMWFASAGLCGANAGPLRSSRLERDGMDGSSAGSEEVCAGATCVACRSVPAVPQL